MRFSRLLESEYRAYLLEDRFELKRISLIVAVFIWLAENISTFFHVWSYPNQLGAWAVVHVGKWSSWALLVVMTFTIVANLKHIKARIHVPD